MQPRTSIMYVSIPHASASSNRCVCRALKNSPLNLQLTHVADSVLEQPLPQAAKSEHIMGASVAFFTSAYVFIPSSRLEGHWWRLMFVFASQMLSCRPHDVNARGRVCVCVCLWCVAVAVVWYVCMVVCMCV